MTLTEIGLLVGVGLAAGVLSGMFGVGGGVIIVPSLVFFMGMTQHQAQGTSIGVMLLPIGILAAYNYYRAGSLDIRSAFIIALAFVLGGYFGSKVSIGLSEATLKRIFGILMLVISVKLIFFTKSTA